MDVVLVSDAGKPFLQLDAIPRNWFSQLGRARDIALSQVGAFRKSELIGAFERKELRGTYWGIDTDISAYCLESDDLSINNPEYAFSAIRTRLNRFSDEEQGKLINWGYALSSAALKRRVENIVPLKIGVDWPIPGFRL